MKILDDPSSVKLALDHELETTSIEANPVGFSHTVSPSSLGKECAAFVWNQFRWISKKNVPGRIRRLFETGNSAEPYIRELLERMGWRFMPPPDNWKKQHKIEDFDGHMKGYLDDIAAHDEYTNGEYIYIEYKTYNTKRFSALKNKAADGKGGVAITDFEYYVQTQIYMKYKGLPACLFVAINKNDSDVYFEIIPYNDNVATQYINRAHDVINSQTQLRKISTNPTSHKCKFCDYFSQCHEGAPPDKNCRSCSMSHPAPDGRWYCTKWEMLIPKDAVKDGCDFHQSII